MITAEYLVEYCKAQVGKHYWNGTFGNGASKSLYEANKKRLPSEYKWAYNGEYDGEKVHDCHGLIKGAFWCKDKNSTAYDYGKDMPDCDIPTTYARSTSKGTIATMPECAGIYLYTKTKGHIAVYIGNGELTEARGHDYGVQRNKLKDRPCFTHWSKDTKFVSFSSAPAIDFNAKRKDLQRFLHETYQTNLTIDGRIGKASLSACVVGIQTELNKLGECLVVDGGFGKNTKAAMSRHMLKKGDKGTLVKILQGLLYNNEIDCNGFDSSFGAGCEKAVKEYQTKKGLEIDGKVGGETFAKLVGR